MTYIKLGENLCTGCTQLFHNYHTVSADAAGALWGGGYLTEFSIATRFFLQCGLGGQVHNWKSHSDLFVFKKYFFSKTLWWVVIDRKKFCLVKMYYCDFFFTKKIFNLKVCWIKPFISGFRPNLIEHWAQTGRPHCLLQPYHCEILGFSLQQPHQHHVFRAHFEAEPHIQAEADK